MEIANKSHPCSLSLYSSLSLSPVGFPRVTICSYRSSFGSLGNFPFNLPLWNSGLSLSTALLHTPHAATPHAAKPSFLSPSCLIPPLELLQVSFLRCFLAQFLPHPPKTLSQTQYSVSDWTIPGNSPSPAAQPSPLIRKARKMQWWVVKHTHKKHHLRQTLGHSAEVVHSTQAFSSGVYIATKKKSLQQWADGIVHLIVADTRTTLHVHFSYYRRNHFYKTKLNLTFGACFVVCMEQVWSGISQMHWIAVEMLHRNQERDGDIKSIEQRWPQTQAHPCKNTTLILWD